MSCGELGPIDGGLIKNSTIQDSNINGSTFTGGTVQASVVKASSLESLASIDAASVRTIADALASDPSFLSELAAAIFASNPSAYAMPADPSQGDDLPTETYGSRDAVLGRPVSWIAMGDYVLPAFQKRSA